MLFEKWALKSRIPVIGSWLNRKAIESVAQKNGSRAANGLIEALSIHTEGPVRAFALENIRGLEDRFARSLMCTHWVETRDTDLEQIIQSENWVASNPLESRILTALLTGRLNKLTPDPVTDGSIYVPAENVDTFRLIDLLLEAREDDHPVIQEQADVALRAKIAEGLAWMAWIHKRDPALEAILMDVQEPAQKPAQARVLSRLKLGQADSLKDAKPDELPALLEAANDPDPAIAEPVPGVLRELSRRDSRKQLFEHALHWEEGNGNEAATEAVQAAIEAKQFKLSGIADIPLAGWLFLNGSWEDYDGLDFDRRLLSEFYANAPKALQKRVAAKIRDAGRIELLAVIGGSTDLRHRAAELREDEAQFIITMLSKKKQWDDLWKMTFEVSLRQSVRAVKALRKAKKWSVPSGDEPVFERLAELADEVELLKPERVGEILPPAIRRATADVRGRVNTVALSPARPLVAIGTNDGRAALWNFQTGEIEQTWKFRKVVGRVAFTAEDLFVCSEGKASGKPSTLRIFHPDGSVSEIEHDHMITGIDAAGGSRIVVSRNDGVQLFDTDTMSQISFQSYDDFWCRNIRVAPDASSALLLHERLTVVGLPDLEVRAGIETRVRQSILACASYAPGGDQYLLGTNSGKVVIAKEQFGQLLPEDRNLFTFGAIAGVETVESLDMVVAGGGRTIRFHDWGSRKPIGTVDTGDDQLASLHVSPKGDFIAAGHRNDTMSFWDMRVIDIPRMFVAPFARSAPRQLAAVRGLREQGIAKELDAALNYFECVLQYRFRFDIELGELQSIRAGEFDIELE